MNLPSRTPALLIVGAMKAGTTSLYFDLQQVPRVFFPLEKEPEVLVQVADAAEARAWYAKIYAGAEEQSYLVDASTAYTKLPDYQGAAARAIEVCADARVIYLVRDPVDRAVSHYRHDRALGIEERAPDDALTNGAHYVQYSDYGYQLEPWLKAFGPERVRIVEMDAYAARRAETLEALCRWLGLTPPQQWRDLDTRYNKAGDKRSVPGWAERLLASAVYQGWIRPAFSPAMRIKLKQALFPPNSEVSADISSATREHLDAMLGGRYRDFLVQHAGLFLRSDE